MLFLQFFGRKKLNKSHLVASHTWKHPSYCLSHHSNCRNSIAHYLINALDILKPLAGISPCMSSSVSLLPHAVAS